MIRDVHPGFRIPDLDFFTHSGSRIQGRKRHQIPDPDPQHWIRVTYIRRIVEQLSKRKKKNLFGENLYYRTEVTYQQKGIGIL
jgi:hypothetical protein